MERSSKTFTANGKHKLLPSVFSSLYSRIKTFAFGVNRDTFLFVYDLFKDKMKRIENQRQSLPFAVCRKHHAFKTLL